MYNESNEYQSEVHHGDPYVADLLYELSQEADKLGPAPHRIVPRTTHLVEVEPTERRTWSNRLAGLAKILHIKRKNNATNKDSIDTKLNA